MKDNPYVHDCGCNDADVPTGVLPDTFNTDVEGVFIPLTSPFLIPICVTLEQYQAIVDSLDYAKGLLSDNNCKNERTAIELLHSAMLHVNDPIGANCVDTCDIVSQCVTENETTQNSILNMLINALSTNQNFLQALQDAVGTDTVNQGSYVGDSAYASNLLPDSLTSECDQDKLFGACRGVIKYIDRAFTDFIQDLEVTTNALESAAIAAGAIPAAGGTLEAGFELADQILEAVGEGYAGAYTQEVEDTLACELFCKALDNDCSLSLDEVNAVFLERLVTLDFEDFAAWVAYFSTGTFTGVQIVDAAFMLVIQAMRYGNKFADIIGLQSLAVIAKAASEEDPSSAWQDLCPGCGTWVSDNDISALAAWDDYTYADTGVYSSGNGWGANTGAYTSDCIFGINFSSPVYVVSIEVYFTDLMTGNIKAVGWGNMPDLSPQSSVTQSGLMELLPISQTLDGIAVLAIDNSPQNATTFPGYINRVIVRGRGTKPAELP